MHFNQLQPDAAMGMDTKDKKVALELPPPMEPAARGPREPFKFAGYLAAVSSSFLISTSVLLLKLLPVEDSLAEKAKACMIRGMIVSVLCAITVVHQGHSFLVTREEALINFLRAVLGALATLLVYVAVNFITMGECSALIYSSPIWTCMISYFVLREPLKVSMLLGIPVSLAGIVLLAHPDLLVSTEREALLELDPNDTVLPGLLFDDEEFDEEAIDRRMIGVALSIVGSIFFAITIVVLRLRRRTPISTCSFYLGLATMILSACFQCFTGFGAMPASLFECGLLFGIGSINYVSQALLQWALQFVDANSYSVMRSLDIALGFVLGAVFLGEAVLWTSLLGSLLIILVIVMLVVDDLVGAKVKSMFWARQ